jgi:hypothetical protein
VEPLAGSVFRLMVCHMQRDGGPPVRLLEGQQVRDNILFPLDVLLGGQALLTGHDEVCHLACHDLDCII